VPNKSDQIITHQMLREQDLARIEELEADYARLQEQYAALREQSIAQAEQASDEPVAGMVLAPDFRGYAHLGIGAYLINHSAELPAELVITPATEADKAGREVGSEVVNPDDAPPILPEQMAVRIRFENPAGLDALEAQLRHIRRVHFGGGQGVSHPSPREARLEALLRELHALVRGESPRLLTDYGGDDGDLDGRIRAELEAKT
jgi:hypothetical protein